MQDVHAPAVEQAAEAAPAQLRHAAAVRGQARSRLFRLALVAADAVALLAATLGAAQLRFHTFAGAAALGGPGPRITYLELSLALVAMCLLAMRWQHLYDLGRLGWGTGEFTRLLSALTVGTAVLVLTTYALKLPGLSRAWILLSWTLASVLVTATRLAERTTVRTLRANGMLLHPTIIAGSNFEAAELVRILTKDISSGLVPVGYVTAPGQSSSEMRHIPCLGTIDDLAAVVEDARVDTVLFASSAFGHSALAEVVSSLAGSGVKVRVSSGLLDVLTSRIAVNEVSGIPILAVQGRSLTKSKAMQKRAFDIVVSGVLVLLLSPVFIVVWALVRATSAGPALYRQERVGVNGKAFEMLKFRSMVADADSRRSDLLVENESSGPLFKMRRDPRVTPVGRWLRLWSLDELPQLFNVLAGDMSLVGPRPALPSEVEQYAGHEERRLDVVPGITGLWQVSGRSDLTFDEMVRLDLFYIRNWSLRLDLSLLLRTLPAVILARGSY